MTLCDKILDYIFANGSISPLEAVRDLNCYSLAARIKDLRGQGFIINTKHETYINREGKCSTYSRYYMDAEDLTDGEN